MRLRNLHQPIYSSTTNCNINYPFIKRLLFRSQNDYRTPYIYIFHVGSYCYLMCACVCVLWGSELNLPPYSSHSLQTTATTWRRVAAVGQSCKTNIASGCGATVRLVWPSSRLPIKGVAQGRAIDAAVANGWMDGWTDG